MGLLDGGAAAAGPQILYWRVAAGAPAGGAASRVGLAAGADPLVASAATSGSSRAGSPATGPAGRYAAALDVDTIRRLAPGDAFEVSLPRGVRQRLYVVSRESHAGGETTWIARGEGADADHPTVITLGDGVASAVVRTADGDFRLDGEAGGAVLLDLGDPALAPAVPTENDAFPPPAARPAEGLAGVAASLADGIALPKPPRRKSVVDLLVLYTPGMRVRHGAGVRARIETLVAIANQAYAASGVALRLRLVHAAEVAYPERTSNAEALGHVTNGTHAAVAGARELRDRVGADLVVLLRPYENAAHGGCGTGWIGGWGGVPLAFANGFAYSVVSDGESQGYFCDDVSFAHEVSHNLGCMHDRATVAWQGGGQGAYDFGFGYGVSGRFGTVMSYTFPRLAHFSNPDQQCAGVPCGVDEARSDSANNALALELARVDAAVFRPSAQLDFGFGALGRVVQGVSGARAAASAVAIAPGGKIVVAGTAERSKGARASIVVARFLASGAPDASFSADGVAEFEIAGARLRGAAAAVQADGKVVVAGSLEDARGVALAVVRFTAEGAIDTSFSGDGILLKRRANRRLRATAVVLDGDRIVVAGTAEGTGADAGKAFVLVARVRKGGGLDRSFRGGLFEEAIPGGAGTIDAAALDPTGRIVLAGTSLTSPGAGRSRMLTMRLRLDGALDTSYGDRGSALADLGGRAGAAAVAIAGDGSVIAGGSWVPAGQTASRAAIARFTAGGKLDPGFGNRGIAKRRLGDGDTAVSALAVDASGKILAAGGFANAAGDGDFVVLRYRRDGLPQRPFGSGGVAATAFDGGAAAARALAAHDGGFVVAGTAASGSARAFAIARYLP